MKARIIGLTGQTGGGKTTVSAVLSQEGFACIDCDRVSREVTVPGSPCLGELVWQFGAQILRADGSLDRKGLGARVFGDAAQRQNLERIIFPHIIAELRRRTEELKEVPGVVLDAPTLYESGVDRMCGEVIAVVAPEAARLARIRTRDGLTEEDALRRMAAQQADAFYTARADYLLVNNGTEEQLRAKARELAHQLLAIRS